MQVTIIGYGNMGSGLAEVFAKSGASVVFGAKDTNKAQTVAARIGHGVRAQEVRQAAAGADVVVLAVPYGEAASALRAAGDLSAKIVIDITNPLTADYMGLTVGHDTSAAEEIQRLIPGAKVVKAFNTVFAQIFAHGPRLQDTPVPVFIAGDDETATRRVEELAARAGFDPVQVGALKHARYLEPLAGLNIVLGYGRGWGTLIAPAWLREPQSR